MGRAIRERSSVAVRDHRLAGMVTRVQLRNFRGFSNAGIELRPLTVLLGPNSAGKSSFAHALAAMGHAQWVHNGSAQATLTPKDSSVADEWPIDLGRYRDLRSDNCSDRVYVDLLTRGGPVTLGFGAVADLKDLRLSYIRYPLAPDQTGPADILKESPASSKSEGDVTAPSGEKDVKIVSAPGLEVARLNEVQWQGMMRQPMAVGLNGLLLDTVRHESGTEVPLGSFAKDDLRLLFENTVYLRASRRRPSRGYAASASRRGSLGYAGEWAASILHSQVDADVTYTIPIEVPHTPEEARRVIDAPWQRVTSKLPEAVGYWLRRLGIGNAVEVVPSDTYPGMLAIKVRLRDHRPSRDITEIGYGLSQILPILVGGLLQSSHGIFIVDLPEGHLHPKPQALLADFFVSLALSGKRVLIETHSEMLFHWLRLRAALSTAVLERSAVYFFEPPSEDGVCQQPRLVGLDKDEELKWPAGFLQEAWETESYIRVAREGRRLTHA